MAAVAYEKKDHVAVVTLKNAGKRHWSEPEWIAEVQAAVKQVERDLDVYVLLFTDAGACSKEMAAPDKQNNAEQSRQLEELCAAVRSLRVPVIAAMNGFSLDGSCDLVKACDICMASETVEETARPIRWWRRKRLQIPLWRWLCRSVPMGRSQCRRSNGASIWGWRQEKALVWNLNSRLLPCAMPRKISALAWARTCVMRARKSFNIGKRKENPEGRMRLSGFFRIV